MAKLVAPRVLAAALLLILVASSAIVEACDSTSTLSGISDCASAVAVGTGTGKASQACCSELKAIGRECLCDLLHGPVPNGINLTLAALLPGQCGLEGASSC